MKRPASLIAICLLLAACSSAPTKGDSYAEPDEPSGVMSGVGPKLINGCPATGEDVLKGVYHPQRLAVKDPCKTVTGTVAHLQKEKDGDYHIRVTLDKPYGNLLTTANKARQHGDLVVELMPRDANLRAPKVGERVRITGAYVLDRDHGDWAEIHPVWALEVIR